MRKYYEIKNGKIKYDRLTTFINNNEWTLILVVVLSLLVVGIIEAL